MARNVTGGGEKFNIVRNVGFMSGLTYVWIVVLLTVLYGSMQFFRRGHRSFTQQRITLALAVPCAEAIQLCIRALPSVKATLREGDPKSGRIVATTGISGRTWGDVLEMEVTPIDASHTSVLIVASQVFKSTIVDWGQNRHLLSVLRRELLTGEASG